GTSVTFTDVHPTASAGGDQTVSEGTTVNLSGSASNTSGDAIVSYAWDLDNNGSFETAGQNVNLTPDLPGNYTVKVKATHDGGEQDGGPARDRRRRGAGARHADGQRVESAAGQSRPGCRRD